MNEFWNIIVDNLFELIATLIFGVIVCFLAPWWKNTVVPFISNNIVPWLKEKRLYTVVSRFVMAAEKLAQNQAIDKKQYVIKLLESKGIELTPEVEAYIESSVEELDLLVKDASNAITKSDDSNKELPSGE